MSSAYTPDEMMTVAAARMVRDGAVLFVGIGLPGAAANLARRTHAPGAVLIYEAGAIGAKPSRLPLSIGDSELAETADFLVSVPEMFAYWLQAGRIDLGFLGAAQVDRFGNINSTVIGPYNRPAVRLPGAGGAPEIAAFSREVVITLRHSPRTLVEVLDFRTSPGYLDGGKARERLQVSGRGPVAVITDLGMLTPDPESKELILASIHPGVAVETVVAQTGWPLKVAPHPTITEAPSVEELAALRSLVSDH